MKNYGITKQEPYPYPVTAPYGITEPKPYPVGDTLQHETQNASYFYYIPPTIMPIKHKSVSMQIIDRKPQYSVTAPYGITEPKPYPVRYTLQHKTQNASDIYPLHLMSIEHKPVSMQIIDRELEQLHLLNKKFQDWLSKEISRNKALGSVPQQIPRHKIYE